MPNITSLGSTCQLAQITETYNYPSVTSIYLSSDGNYLFTPYDRSYGTETSSIVQGYGVNKLDSAFSATTGTNQIITFDACFEQFFKYLLISQSFLLMGTNGPFATTLYTPPNTPINNTRYAIQTPPNALITQTYTGATQNITLCNSAGITLVRGPTTLPKSLSVYNYFIACDATSQNTNTPTVTLPIVSAPSGTVDIKPGSGGTAAAPTPSTLTKPPVIFQNSVLDTQIQSNAVLPVLCPFPILLNSTSQNTFKLVNAANLDPNTGLYPPGSTYVTYDPDDMAVDITVTDYSSVRNPLDASFYIRSMSNYAYVYVRTGDFPSIPRGNKAIPWIVPACICPNNAAASDFIVFPLVANMTFKYTRSIINMDLSDQYGSANQNLQILQSSYITSNNDTIENNTYLTITTAPTTAAAGTGTLCNGTGTTSVITVTLSKIKGNTFYAYAPATAAIKSYTLVQFAFSFNIDSSGPTPKVNRMLAVVSTGVIATPSTTSLVLPAWEFRPVKSKTDLTPSPIILPTTAVTGGYSNGGNPLTLDLCAILWQKFCDGFLNNYIFAAVADYSSCQTASIFKFVGLGENAKTFYPTTHDVADKIVDLEKSGDQHIDIILSQVCSATDQSKCLITMNEKNTPLTPALMRIAAYTYGYSKTHRFYNIIQNVGEGSSSNYIWAIIPPASDAKTLGYFHIVTTAAQAAAAAGTVAAAPASGQALGVTKISTVVPGGANKTYVQAVSDYFNASSTATAVYVDPVTTLITTSGYSFSDMSNGKVFCTKVVDGSDATDGAPVFLIVYCKNTPPAAGATTSNGGTYWGMCIAGSINTDPIFTNAINFTHIARNNVINQNFLDETFFTNAITNKLPISLTPPLYNAAASGAIGTQNTAAIPYVTGTYMHAVSGTSLGIVFDRDITLADGVAAISVLPPSALSTSTSVAPSPSDYSSTTSTPNTPKLVTWVTLRESTVPTAQKKITTDTMTEAKTTTQDASVDKFIDATFTPTTGAAQTIKFGPKGVIGLNKNKNLKFGSNGTLKVTAKKWITARTIGINQTFIDQLINGSKFMTTNVNKGDNIQDAINGMNLLQTGPDINIVQTLTGETKLSSTGLTANKLISAYAWQMQKPETSNANGLPPYDPAIQTLISSSGSCAANMFFLTTTPGAGGMAGSDDATVTTSSQTLYVSAPANGTDPANGGITLVSKPTPNSLFYCYYISTIE